MSDGDSMWSQKGATMSDKSARQEFGLTQQEIIAAIRAGKLQFRESNMHGNPWYRLLRHEVESLVRDKSGLDHLTKKKLQKELADLNTEARKLTTRLKAIERRRTELMKELAFIILEMKIHKLQQTIRILFSNATLRFQSAL